MPFPQRPTVVGYNTADTFAGNQGVGGCFMPISGTGTMADIKITGYGKEYVDGGINCTKLDTYGRTISQMFWIDYHDEEVSAYGWYSDNEGSEDCNGVPLAAGEGLWMKIPNAAFKVQSAGQVASETIPVALIAGNQLCPNPTPVTVEMGNVFMAGYGSEYVDGGINCTKLDTYGRTIKQMFWIDFSDEEVTAYGWYVDNEGSEDCNSETLKPGESVWLKCPTKGWTLNWPSPL